MLADWIDYPKTKGQLLLELSWRDKIKFIQNHGMYETYMREGDVFHFEEMAR